MPKFKDSKSLIAALKKEINDTLQNEVFEEVRDIMQEHIQEDVYDVYNPKVYIRSYDLIDDKNIQMQPLENGIKVTNETYQRDRFGNPKYIPEVIETGSGYDYAFEYNGVPRPFIQNTKEDLDSNKQHIDALKSGLKKRGIDVK